LVKRDADFAVAGIAAVGLRAGSKCSLRAEDRVQSEKFRGNRCWFFESDETRMKQNARGKAGIYVGDAHRPLSVWEST
jgi:hypothetical protein